MYKNLFNFLLHHNVDAVIAFVINIEREKFQPFFCLTDPYSAFAIRNENQVSCVKLTREPNFCKICTDIFLVFSL